MNPVTRGLLAQLEDPQVAEFAEDWDTLENLVVEIYRQKSVTFEQQQTFFDVQQRLQQSYPRYEEEFGRYWPHVRVKGELVVGDPFQALIRQSGAKAFVENWDAMRTLPAARESLNQMLVARIAAK